MVVVEFNSEVIRHVLSAEQQAGRTLCIDFSLEEHGRRV